MESFVVHEFGLFLPVIFEHRQVYAYIDLGAHPGGVVPGIAEHCQVTGTKTKRGAFGQKETSLVKVPEFSFLGKRFQNIELSVSHQENFSNTALPVHFHLGARDLLAAPLWLDFHRLTAEFRPAGERRDFITVPIRQSHNLILFALTVQGKELQAVFDTGAGVSVINSAHLDELGLEMTWAYDVEAHDPSGAIAQVGMYWLPDLHIQGINLGDTEVAQVDLSSIEAALGTRVDLLFGANTMLKTARTWLLDREQQSMSVSRR